MNDKTHKIVKVTSITSNLIYYGCTSSKVTEWWKKIVYAALKGDCPASKINKAIREFGKDDFQVEVVDEDEDFEHARNTLLPSYISADGTYVNGLNVTTGGVGTPRLKFNMNQRSKCCKAARKRVLLGQAFGDWDASETKWVTNGVYNRRIHVNARIPKGFHLGKRHGVKFRRK